MDLLSPTSITKLPAGVGRIVLASHGSNAVFSELSSTYPLKLLSPNINQDRLAVVYVLTYGGGLVGGDHVDLSVDVTTNSMLVLLSQGSTKVFKTRAEQRLASVHRERSAAHLPGTSQASQVTVQDMNFTVTSESALFLLPDPVTCFRSASYNQIQRFHLSKGASLVVLDWVTSGRKSLGESWAFSRYYSLNEVVVEGKTIAKDIMLLDDKEMDTLPLPGRGLADRLAPYSCYATLILYGPLVQRVIHDLVEQYQRISVMKSTAPPELLWSLSSIMDGAPAAVVRVAGKETELVKKWLGDALIRLEEVVGVDVYRRAFI